MAKTTLWLEQYEEPKWDRDDNGKPRATVNYTYRVKKVQNSVAYRVGQKLTETEVGEAIETLGHTVNIGPVT